MAEVKLSALYAVFSIPHICLYCIIDPRKLHSFPTRRSSDLRGRANEASGRNSELARLGGIGPVRLRAVIDRKSTRLNSSHVSISYAVFCLKKKRYRSDEPAS